MKILLLVLLQLVLVAPALSKIERMVTTFPKNIEKKSVVTQSRFTEPSTNMEYVYLGDYNDYRLYKLTHQYSSTPNQILTVNRLLEKYLQESFDAPDRSYPNVVQLCGTTMLAFFARNMTPSTQNIHALLLARLEAYDNSKYVCYLSVLKEHRQKGLGTKLLNEFINTAIRANNSQVSLHVNTENTSALPLYLKCGMRCISYIPGFYFGDQTYATQNAFTMALQLKNVRDPSTICLSSTAVDIPQQEESIYKQQCPQSSTG